MDTLSNVLRPFKDVIGTIASYLTIAQFFSGVFICLDIKKKGNTKDVSSVPFVGGIMVGLSMLKYAYMLQDPAMLRVNIAAIILNALYCSFYYFYSDDKWNQLLKPLSMSMGFVAVLWGYSQVEDQSALEYRYGLIVTILMLVLLGSPLRDIKDIMAKKDASQIPFVLTFMGAIVTFSWFLYALILKNDFMIFQNMVGFVLCLVQLILIFSYPGKPQSTKTKKKSS